MFNSDRLVNSPMEVGRGPHRELYKKFNVFKEFRYPIEVGNDPEIPTEARLIVKIKDEGEHPI